MKLPIDLKSHEFVVLVSVDVDPAYIIPKREEFFRTLPKSFTPIFTKVEGSTVNLYCVCNNEEDFTYCLRQTGFKVSLI